MSSSRRIPRGRPVQIGTVRHKGNKRPVPVLYAPPIDRSKYTPEKLREIRADGRHK